MMQAEAEGVSAIRTTRISTIKMMEVKAAIFLFFNFKTFHGYFPFQIKGGMWFVGCFDSLMNLFEGECYVESNAVALYDVVINFNPFATIPNS